MELELEVTGVKGVTTLVESEESVANTIESSLTFMSRCPVFAMSF
jgi:hypothetical protein